MARRHRNMFIFVVFSILFYRFFLLKQDIKPVQPIIPDVFENLMTQEDIVLKDLDESLKLICKVEKIDELRKGLECDLDKLCPIELRSREDCAGRIAFLSEHNPNRIKLKLTDISLEEAGNIIDYFLSSHSIWYIIQEPYVTDTTTALAAASGSVHEFELECYQFSIARELYIRLDNLQYTRNCTNIWSEKIVEEDFVKSIGYFSYGISVGFLSGNCFVVDVSQLSIFKDCSQASWTCYFLPFTNCSIPYYDDEESQLTQSLPQQGPGILNPGKIPEPFQTLLKSTGITDTFTWWRFHLSNYFLRPNYRTRKILWKLEQIFFKLSNFTIEEPCVTVHLTSIEKLQTRGIRNFLNLFSADWVFLIYEEDAIKNIQKIKDIGTKVFFVEPEEILKDVGLLESEKKVFLKLLEMRLAGYCGAFVGEPDSDYSFLIFQWMCILKGNCVHSGGLEWTKLKY